MPTIYTLEESNVTVSGGGQLDGVTQGDGTHLLNPSPPHKTITLNNNSWVTVDVTDNDANFQDNDGSQTLTNSIVYDGTSFAAGLRVEAEYHIWVEDPGGTVYELIAFNIVQTGGPNTYGTIEGLSFVDTGNGFPPTGVPLQVTSVSEGPTGSTTPYSSYASPPCFAKGTLISTPHGPKHVEDLRSGDLVTTMTGDAQQIRWIGQSDFDTAALKNNPNLRPILIKAGAFGPERPIRDLRVSPQHRVLVDDWRSSVMFGQEMVLVAAKHLVNDDEITVDRKCPDVSYFHILLDEHHLLISEGIHSESFQPGPQSLTTLSADTLRDLLDFIEERGPLKAKFATLKSWEGELLRP